MHKLEDKVVIITGGAANIGTEQLHKLTLCSRSFFSTTSLLNFQSSSAQIGYGKVSPVNTSAEATGTAIKLARKYGYDIKAVPG